MPPKKKDKGDAEPPPLIGRVGTSLKIGIVGLPNVGKSTLFNVLTKSAAAAENYPFCTIDPNESRVAVPDERFEFLCDHYKPASKVPAFLNVVDIAGLVKGAHEGQGLGNAFLSNIGACDAIYHMTRAFDDDDVTHVEGDVDPVRDMEIIHTELRKKDEEYLEKRIQDIEKKATRANDKTMKAELDTFLKIRQTLAEEKPLRFRRDWTTADIEVLNKHLFITSKPMIYLINLSEKDFIRKKNKYLAKMMEWIKDHDSFSQAIPISARLENRLFEMEDDVEREKFLRENGLKTTLTKVIVAGYNTLSLQYFFTVGEDEVKAWSIQKGTKAPQAAGRIHSDMEKGFIMAEVMKYVDFKEHGNEADVRGAGKYRQQGRNYVVNDGDILLIKFNAGAGLTTKKKQ